MTLSESVSKFIENEKLFSASSKLICAVSGGKDSMAMLHVLNALGYDIVVAHVNYRLRNEESDKDQTLIEEYCLENRIKCDAKVIDNQLLESLQNGNLQEKARKIRYDWFYQVKVDHKADYICTAHHIEDVAETFLLNALRSSGIKGLKSIDAINSDIRRPFLDLTLSEITDYTKKHNIKYRLDKSNSDSKYDRNYVRNVVFPIIENRWHRSHEKIASSAKYLSLDYQLLLQLVSQEKKKWIVSTDSQDILGPINELKNTPQARTLAFHLLRNYNFSPEVICDMIFENHQSGKTFESFSHIAIVDRNRILIQKNVTPTQFTLELSSTGKVSTPLGNIVFKESKEYPQGREMGCFDAMQVSWPLTIRTWKYADKITPLGMQGQHKKVSDIFIDNKLSKISKSKQIVVCDSTGEIIWIPGLKISEKVKYHDGTISYLIADWHPL